MKPPSSTKVFLAFWLALLAAGCVTTPRVDRSPTGRELSLPVQDLQGVGHTLTGKRGRVTVVVVFATWCDACGSALSFADELSRAEPSTIDVVAVSVDADPRLLAAHPVNRLAGLRVLWDPEGAMAARRLAVDRVPTILVVDEEDRIRRSFAGWERGTERALMRAVDSFRPQDPCLMAPPGTD